MKYEIFIHDNWTVYHTASDAAEAIIEELEETAEGDALYDESLDDCFEEIDICGYKYAPSEALRRVDPVAYRCGKLDYFDSLYSDVEEDLERMDLGDTSEFYGIEARAIPDDDEEEISA